MKPLDGMEVLLGVTGGIAAYKSVELARALRQEGAGVTAVMTEAATRFVGPATFAALTGRPVRTGLFDGPDAISHIELTAGAGLFIVAPATADIIGKASAGIADDLLSTMLAAARCPVLMAPAMNCRMFDNPILRRNIRTLRDAGYHFVGPEKGKTACGEEGWGRMSEPADIIRAALSVAAAGRGLAGKKVLVSAGPTCEDIDPIRFIGNRSTGRMGYAVAGEARARGAEVKLVSGPTELEPPPGVETVRVRTAAEMSAAMKAAAGKADIIIMAAAVADFRPARVSSGKIKKEDGPDSISLVRTPDILKGLGEKKRKGQLLVGFAAETEDLEKNARGKLREKNLDLVAANMIAPDSGFGSSHNDLKVYGPKGLVMETGRVPKDEAARALMDLIVRLA